MKKPHKWTDEQNAYLREIVSGRSWREIATLMEERFPGYGWSPRMIGNSIKNKKLSTGRTGRFEKGNVPMNKGLKQSEYMSSEAIERTKATRYKKGELPPNHRQIGDERISEDGYIEVKVSMFRHKKANDCWKLKHRLIWEEANGEIPDGHVVIFIDGNKQNLSLSNLRLVSREQMVRLNRKKLLGINAEITESAIALVNLEIKRSEYA